MSNGWRVKPYGPGNKTITLVGPSDGFYPQQIYIDYDDVNRPEIERRIPLIVEALNGLELSPPETKHD